MDFVPLHIKFLMHLIEVIHNKYKYIDGFLQYQIPTYFSLIFLKFLVAVLGGECT